ncbi:MAG TPA: amidase [Candidatus Aminicenantes bacterium]|nr:amidase [Candidatus Aminicenantes bacterium]
MRDRGHAGGPRGFGFVGIVVCVGLAVSLGPACRPAGEGPADKAAARASEAGSGAIAPFPLEEATIVSLQQMMAAGDETSESIVRLYLERIEAIDRTDGDGPGLNAVIEVNPDALAIARELDRERQEKGPRGPMHGIPVLIKDNIDTADKMETTAGSLALLGSKPAKDAFVVERLREAGAVILGKANLSEWANFRSTRSTSGWSGRGGQTKNPYALDRNPSGSSSGSAAAVAANLVAVAIGTETDGSIVSPASCCGVVGLKPTVGLVSRSGIVPIAHSQDTAGPMARTVADAAILLGAMAGPDADDPATQATGVRLFQDYREFLEPGGLRGARIGVLRDRRFNFAKMLDPILENAVEAMKREGAEIVDPVEIATLGQTGDAEYEVLLYEFKADLEAYFAGRPGAAVHTLEDLIAFNEGNADREMPFFGQEIVEQAAKKGPLTDKAYLDALAKCRELTREKGIDAVLEEHKLDALLVLTNGPAHLTDLVNGDSFSGSSSSPAAVAGYPTITLPGGYAFGLPVGVSLVGRAWSEPELIRLAYGLERALDMRRPPRLLTTADLTTGVTVSFGIGPGR